MIEMVYCDVSVRGCS